MADRDVRKLAAAVCDGEAIDWRALQQPGDPATENSVRGLAALQELFGEQRARQPATPTRNVPFGSACLMILAATQCAAAMVGYVLERGEGAPGPEVLPLAVIVALAITAFALLAFGRRD